jgi:peptide/nickel transport system ATP-binding protein
MLKLDRVSKVYKVGTFGGTELRAVRNVSFDVKDGEVTSLIGESGSGKTTIGKMILRLLSVASGTISLDGVDISTLEGEALKEFYRKVQGVFQDPFSSFNPIFKADRMFQILKDEFYPDMESGAWAAKVADALKCVGLNPEHVLNKFPHQLSGGQLQRFLIARACLLDIDLLVADEIISMLDASTRIDVLNLLADLKAGGLSILFITHDLSLAYYISERAIILQRGCVVEMGSAQKVFQNPLHPYTRMLMASVPRLDKKWETVEEAAGVIAKPSDMTGGPAERGGDGHEAELVEVEPDHFVSTAG